MTDTQKRARLSARSVHPGQIRRARPHESKQPAAQEDKRLAAARPAPLLSEARIGLEGRAASDDHQSLKLWLRLLSCSTQIQTEIRKRLRIEFGMSLARFDYLAQLHRCPEGLRMNALSRFLMVTGGSVTGLTDELEKDGLVERVAEPSDRRSFRVLLTERGREAFERIASVHEGWVVEIFEGLDASQRSQLHESMGRLRMHLAALQGAADDKSVAA